MKTSQTRTEQEVRDALREVLDPEYPISRAEIKLTYTCMGCPAMDMIQDDVRERLLEMDGIEVVEIEVVWPTWSREDITPLGRKQLKDVGVV